MEKRQGVGVDAAVSAAVVGRLVDHVGVALQESVHDHGQFRNNDDADGYPPTLLERDFNIPPLAELLPEVERIRFLQAHYAVLRHVA